MPDLHRHEHWSWFTFGVLSRSSYTRQGDAACAFTTLRGESQAACRSNRIVDLKFDDKPVDPAKKFVVAINNAVAAVAATFRGVDASKIICESPNRDVIVNYITRARLRSIASFCDNPQAL